MNVNADIDIDIDALVEEVLNSGDFAQALTDTVRNEVAIDDLISAVLESRDFNSVVSDLIEQTVSDEIETHLNRLDIDDIDGFESRVGEIAQDTIDGQDPNGSTFDNQALVARVDALQAQVDALTEALQAAAILLRGVVVKG